MKHIETIPTWVTNELMLEFMVYFLELTETLSLNVCQAWLSLIFIDGLLDFKD